MSDELLKALEDVPRGRVVIELTEHEEIEEYEQLIGRIAALHDRARLAIDDVGAGYSSMRHILDLGPDIIKLDISLVRDIHQRPARAAFVKAMVEFAKASGTSLVAEGVETDLELLQLSSLGAECAQGYYLGRPAPLLKIAEILPEQTIAPSDSDLGSRPRLTAE